MKAFEHKSMTVGDLIAKLESTYQDKNAVIVADLWDADDIRESGEHLENLSDEQCRVVMAYIEENYSTENGINHDTINDAVDECIEQELIEYSYTE